MSRPSSIVVFERLYLASIAVYLLNAAIFWSATRDLMAGTPQVQSNATMASLVMPIMVVSLVISLGLSLLFWLMTARWRMVAGKWLVVTTEAIGGILGLASLLRLVSGHAQNPGSVAVGLVSTALAVAAATMLFRADAKQWFATAGTESVA